MPKKKADLTPAEQSERFRKVVHDLEVAGELSPTDEAEKRFEKTLKRAAPEKRRR